MKKILFIVMLSFFSTSCSLFKKVIDDCNPGPPKHVFSGQWMSIFNIDREEFYPPRFTIFEIDHVGTFSTPNKNQTVKRIIYRSLEKVSDDTYVYGIYKDVSGDNTLVRYIKIRLIDDMTLMSTLSSDSKESVLNDPDIHNFFATKEI